MRYLNKGTIIIGLFVLAMALFYFNNPTKEPPKEQVPQIPTEVGRYINVTELVNFKPEKLISAITFQNHKNTVKITAYSNEQQIRELFSISVPNSEFLSKMSLTDYVSIQFMQDNKTIVLFATSEIKDTYTKDEIIQGINGFNIGELIEKNRDKLGKSTPIRDTWKQ